MIDIDDIVEKIETKDDFLFFLSCLISDHKNNDWENSNLNDYLSSMEGWLESMDGFYKNQQDLITLDKIHKNELSWKVFAQILFAATMYE